MQDNHLAYAATQDMIQRFGSIYWIALLPPAPLDVGDPPAAVLWRQIFAPSS